MIRIRFYSLYENKSFLKSNINLNTEIPIWLLIINVISECKINGQTATDDRDVTSDDPCLKCRCIDGRLTCSKKACPVLQCSADRQHQPPAECCPKCTGTRSLYTYPKTCTLGSRFHREGERFDIGRCVRCTCSNETSICHRDSCPILNCSPEFQKKPPGSCCKECVLPEEARSQCSYAGIVYEASR